MREERGVGGAAGARPRKARRGVEDGNLLHVLVVAAVALAALGRDGLPLLAARAPAAVRRGDGEVDVLLRVGAHHEGGDVDDLLADADVAVADQDARVVDRLGEAKLEDLGLQAALEEVGGLQRKHVIQLLLGLVEHAQTQQPAEQGTALEHAARVLLLEGQQSTRSLTDAGERQLRAEDLTLVLEAELADELHLVVETLLLEGTPGRTRGLSMVAQERSVWHGSLKVLQGRGTGRT